MASRSKAPKSYICCSTNRKATSPVTKTRKGAPRFTIYSKTWILGSSRVGRLDLDTSGLLVLTNDSGFAELLTNPHYKVPKTYQVKCSTRVTNEQIDRLRAGIELDDGPTRPAGVNRLRDSEKYSFLEIQITEGRNRQVRRMVEAIESKVLKLVRVAIGPVRIGNLEVGKWRELTPAERRSLTHAK